jgi:3-methyladenine DNA glycosylase/8-oxoguanine DNA glycosylase
MLSQRHERTGSWTTVNPRSAPPIAPRARALTARARLAARLVCVHLVHHASQEPRLIEASLRARGPYSLRLSTRFASDATRVIAGGVLRAAFTTEGRIEVVEARQCADGSVVVRARTERGVEQMRFVLGLDDDHSGFLRRFARDPLLGPSVRALRGLRPLRCATVTQALLRALCGQLIAARRARGIERRIIGAATPLEDKLHAPPRRADLGRFSPAELRALGLGGPRASALVRLCRTLDLERLRTVTTDAAAARLVRESRIGPWSVGVICLEGLGRYERGLVGDLGLVKLCAAQRGRWVEPWETAELLEPYGDWAGLASVYLLAGFRRGLVPLRQRLAA